MLAGAVRLSELGIVLLVGSALTTLPILLDGGPDLLGLRGGFAYGWMLLNGIPAVVLMIGRLAGSRSNHLLGSVGLFAAWATLVTGVVAGMSGVVAIIEARAPRSEFPASLAPEVATALGVVAMLAATVAMLDRRRTTVWRLATIAAGAAALILPLDLFNPFHNEGVGESWLLLVAMASAASAVTLLARSGSRRPAEAPAGRPMIRAR